MLLGWIANPGPPEGPLGVKRGPGCILPGSGAVVARRGAMGEAKGVGEGRVVEGGLGPPGGTLSRGGVDLEHMFAFWIAD